MKWKRIVKESNDSMKFYVIRTQIDGETYYLYGSWDSYSHSHEWLCRRDKEYAYIFRDLSDAKEVSEMKRANNKEHPEIFIDTYECTKSESV